MFCDTNQKRTEIIIYILFISLNMRSVNKNKKEHSVYTS